MVYLGGEFGRTPKVGYSTGAGAGKDGRDHWPNCFSAVVAGGCFPAGAVYGVSDSKAGYPSESPVTPEDMAATLFAAMGLDPEAVVQARDGRPMPVSYGKAVAGLVGG